MRTKADLSANGITDQRSFTRKIAAQFHPDKARGDTAQPPICWWWLKLSPSSSCPLVG